MPDQVRHDGIQPFGCMRFQNKSHTELVSGSHETKEDPGSSSRDDGVFKDDYSELS